MVDSSVVLWGQTIVYTLYALAVLVVIGTFGYKITRQGGSTAVSPALFYVFAGLLVVVGVSLHLITYNTIPWASMDLARDQVQPDKTFAISVEDHRFTLPADRLLIDCGDTALFSVTSRDLTYGFGLFRGDNSMMFQMQVVPGHPNDLLWKFDRNGVYTIRSTEYSGPAGAQMIVPDAVEVSGCAAGS